MVINIGDRVWWRGAKCQVTDIFESCNLLTVIHPNIGPSVLIYSKSKPVIRVQASLGAYYATSHIS